MDFTREPIIETIITPRDGCKLVVRNSKGTGQEEYFVDSLEVISFGQALFFRSLEKPKAFLVPVTDYEVLEVREARMVLKNVGLDRSIKIGGGREGSMRAAREAEKIEESAAVNEEKAPSEEVVVGAENGGEARPESRLDKKRDRRRNYRKRRGREEATSKEEEATIAVPALEEGGKVAIPAPEEEGKEAAAAPPLSSTVLSSLLQPPPTLISETISRYRENVLFKNAFFLPEDEQYKPHDKAQDLLNEEDDFSPPSLQEPTYAPSEESSETASKEVEQPDYALEALEEMERKEFIEEHSAPFERWEKEEGMGEFRQNYPETTPLPFEEGFDEKGEKDLFAKEESYNHENKNHPLE